MALVAPDVGKPAEGGTTSRMMNRGRAMEERTYHLRIKRFFEELGLNS